jgi:hypothetical protein
MRRLPLIALAVLVAPLIAPAAFAVGIGLVPFSSWVAGSVSGGYDAYYPPTTLPDSGTVSLSGGGGSSTIN